MKTKILILSLLILSFQSVSLAQMVRLKNVEHKTVTVFSKELNENREVYISIPYDYAESQEEYPVLYVLDGETKFELSSDIANYLSLPRNHKIPPMIVVAIPNTNRNRDLTPTAIESRVESGGANNFLAFLEEELIPYVDSNYRTGSHKILFGHSLGGLFSIYTLFSKPHLFDGYIAASPFLMYDNNYVEKLANKKIDEKIKLNKRLYMSLGDEPTHVETLNRFAKKLDDENLDALGWKYEVFEDENHSSIPLLTLYNGLRFMFPDWKVIKYESISSIDDIKEHYKSLSKKYNYHTQIPERLLITFGYQFMSDDKLALALECFELNIEYYPNSANAYDSYGEALEANKQLQLAKKNYEKACELGEKSNDPQLQAFKKHLEDLTKKLK